MASRQNPTLIPPTPLRAGQLVAALEEDIVLGRLHPRERLVEDELMARFTVKRHVVRDALAKLEQMGLVERRRNVGAMVRAFGQQELNELYELRVVLECEAMRRMPLPLDAADLENLRRIQQGHDLAVSRNEPRAIFRSNQAFHETLYGLCGNHLLAQAIQEYARRTHAIRFGALSAPEQQQRSRSEHHEILLALEKGDRQKLIDLVPTHLLRSRDRYLSMFHATRASSQAGQEG
ncbi:MAG: GntR family transcriptional regulator [Burkholderiaceae bacterium]